MEKVLVIAPHPDDEIIGCGATMAKHIAKGNEVYVVISTQASLGAPELFTLEGTKRCRQEALSAHQYLGVKQTFFLDFPAPALNAYPEYKISNSFVEIFKNLNPTVLYIPHHGDLHQDHKAIYRAALVAARPMGNNRIHSIYCYETLSETEWAPLQEKAFVPNCFVNVTETFGRKITAMQFYKTQLKTFPHPRSVDALEALATFRGATVHVSKAEAFIIERQIEF